MMLKQRAATNEAKLAGPIARILAVQEADGALPWFEDGPWDSWNHAECVMALGVAGEWRAARAGLDALASRQRGDGAFLSEYGNALPMADHVSIARVEGVRVLDTNFTAYVASAVEHFRRLRGNRAAADYWPMVRSAIDHVLDYQHVDGDISWAAEAHGTSIDDALIAGNASILASLGHALDLAKAMREPRPDWLAARTRLREALRAKPHRFGRAESARPAHAMDWYYPVLAGLHDADRSRMLLAEQWDSFVDEGLGCRCVKSEPWVTVAETCELVMALLRCGMDREAAGLLDWLEARRDGDGAFWMGWQQVEAIDWPAERPSWTQAAYVLALDAFERITPAATIFG